MKNLILIFALFACSCSSVKLVNLELYKKALYKNCLTDSECQGIDAKIYEKYYSCEVNR